MADAPDDADEVGGRGDGHGRTFQESFQKALRGLETGVDGLTERSADREIIQAEREPGPGAHPGSWATPSPGLSLGRDFDAHRHRPLVPGADRVKLILHGKLDQLKGRNWSRCRSPSCASLKKGFSTAPGQAAQAPTSSRCASAATRWRAPGLQAGGHLRAEFATQTAYMYSTYEENARPSPPAKRRSWCWAAAPTASARASSSTTAASTRRWPCARTATRPSWSMQPRDRFHRLRHQRPPLLRAGDAGRRARDRRQGKAHWRDRAVRRPDAAEAGAGPGGEGVPIIGTTPDMIDAPKTASASRSCCTTLPACASRPTATARTEAGRCRKLANAGLPAGGAPQLCAGRPRDGNRPRRRGPRTLYARSRQGQQRLPVLLDRFLNDAIEVDVDCISDGVGVIHRRRDGASRQPASTPATACSLPPYYAVRRRGTSSPPDGRHGPRAQGRRPDERQFAIQGDGGERPPARSTCWK